MAGGVDGCQGARVDGGGCRGPVDQFGLRGIVVAEVDMHVVLSVCWGVPVSL